MVEPRVWTQSLFVKQDSMTADTRKLPYARVWTGGRLSYPVDQGPAVRRKVVECPRMVCVGAAPVSGTRSGCTVEGLRGVPPPGSGTSFTVSVTFGNAGVVGELE